MKCVPRSPDITIQHHIAHDENFQAVEVFKYLLKLAQPPNSVLQRILQTTHRINLILSPMLRMKAANACFVAEYVRRVLMKRVLLRACTDEVVAVGDLLAVE